MLSMTSKGQATPQQVKDLVDFARRGALKPRLLLVPDRQDHGRLAVQSVARDVAAGAERDGPVAERGVHVLHGRPLLGWSTRILTPPRITCAARLAASGFLGARNR